MVQNVAVENKVAREILIVRPHDDVVPLLDQNRVPEHADLITVLRVGVRLGFGLLQFRAISLFIENAFAIGAVDSDDLERVYMNMVRMVSQFRTDVPLLYFAQGEFLVLIGFIGMAVHFKGVFRHNGRNLDVEDGRRVVHVRDSAQVRHGTEFRRI